VLLEELSGLAVWVAKVAVAVAHGGIRMVQLSEAESEWARAGVAGCGMRDTQVILL
jgi:hypothetical protein